MSSYMVKKPISEIVIGKRLREVNIEKAKDLADSIREIGLINPIVINSRNELKAGLHRLEACKLLGYTEVDVMVVDVDGNLLDELIEIDENLIRYELNYLERGEQLKRRKEIYEELHPETKVGGDRKSEKSKPNNSVLIPSFVDDTATKIGKSPSTVEQEVQIATVLTDDERQILKEVELPKLEAIKLTRLKKKDPEKASKVLAKIEARETSKVDTAISQVESEDISHTIIEQKPPTGKRTLYTIGYSGKDVYDFVGCLKRNGINLLVDVRDSGRSIYKPAFSSSSLEKVLRENDIKYCQIQELGVVYAVREPYTARFIDNDAFKSWYKWNIDIYHHDEFMKLIGMISKTENVICLMCTEKYAVPTGDQTHYCHRSLLADAVFNYRDVLNNSAIIDEVIHI